jgi:undecaprenyl-diphosphatase
VFIGRFIGFARALVPFVAGASRMPYRRFVVADALGAGLWTVAFVALGYGLGASWQVAEKWISRSGLLLGAVLLIGAAWFWVRRRRRRAEIPQTP